MNQFVAIAYWLICNLVKKQQQHNLIWTIHGPSISDFDVLLLCLCMCLVVYELFPSALKFVYMVAYGKGGRIKLTCAVGHNWHGRGISPWLNAALVEQTGGSKDCQSCVWVESGALEFLSTSFYCSEVSFSYRLLALHLAIARVCVLFPIKRWNYVYNGKLPAFLCLDGVDAGSLG